MLTPSVAVSGIQLSAEDSAVVLLDTAALQLGTLYTAAVSAIL